MKLITTENGNMQINPLAVNGIRRRDMETGINPFRVQIYIPGIFHGFVEEFFDDRAERDARAEELVRIVEAA